MRDRLFAVADSFLCPREVRTNRDTGLIRLLACLFMLVDHVGKMLFPQIPEMRLIGRLAFPMFAYGIAVGAVYTRDPMKYLTRIALLALISQPLYALGLDHAPTSMFSVSLLDDPLGAARAFYIGSWQKPSILLSLFLGLALILSLRQKRWALALFVYVLCARFSSSLDYGLDGIRLMVCFYLLCGHPRLALLGMTAFVLRWAYGGNYFFFGIPFAMRIYCLPGVLLCCLPFRRRMKLPAWFGYAFYPAHLALLAILCRL